MGEETDADEGMCDVDHHKLPREIIFCYCNTATDSLNRVLHLDVVPNQLSTTFILQACHL
jgi:hypothetical protein